MKKTLLITLTIILGIFALCSCGKEIPTVTDQTGNLKYEVPEGWTAKAVSTSPSTIKAYNYGDHTIKIEAYSHRFYEDPLREAIDSAVGDILAPYGGTAQYESGTLAEDTIGGMPAGEMVIENIMINDSEVYSGVFSAVQTETGTYVISSVAPVEILSDDVKKTHRTFLDTIEYVQDRDPEVYAENLFQFGDYICAVPDWDVLSLDRPCWSERAEYSDGVIRYTSDADIATIGLVPMNSVDLTDDIIVDTLEKIYNGKIGPDAECSIADRKMVECAIGSGLLVEATLSFGEDQTVTATTSALFVLDENRKAVCCMSNPADSNAELDYAAVTTSIQKAEPVYNTINALYEKSGDYAGDNSAIGGLLNELEFGVYGDYTFELQTADEPYGVTVKYSGEVGEYDFQREAVILIGLVGNLDYVDIIDGNSNVVHYDYELAKHIMKYDVKKMATDKARLELYYLETLY